MEYDNVIYSIEELEEMEYAMTSDCDISYFGKRCGKSYNLDYYDGLSYYV